MSDGALVPVKTDVQEIIDTHEILKGWRVTKITLAMRSGYEIRNQPLSLQIELEYGLSDGEYLKAEMLVDNPENINELVPYLIAAASLRPGFRLTLAREKLPKSVRDMRRAIGKRTWP